METEILAVAFDMDGLIFDSEIIYKYAWKKAGKIIGFLIPDSLYNRFIGRSTEACERILREEFGENFPLRKFRSLWITLRRQRILEERVRFKEGFQDLMAFFKKHHLKMALTTSSPREDVALNFQNTNYLENFELILSGEDVENSKPHPETYLKAAQWFGIEPSGMLVLEDSNNGMRAAISAGTVAVMVPDMLPPADDVMKEAYRVVNSLTEIRRLPLFENTFPGIV